MTSHLQRWVSDTALSALSSFSGDWQYQLALGGGVVIAALLVAMVGTLVYVVRS